MTDFFLAFGDSTLHLMSRHGTPEHMTVEELFLAFRERLLAELVVSAPDLRTLGILQLHPDITPGVLGKDAEASK